VGLTSDNSTNIINTKTGERRYSELLPDLALGVERVGKAIALKRREEIRFSYGAILDIHEDAFEEIVAWAGRPRKEDVTVGYHLPPPHWQVRGLLRDFADDLQYKVDQIEKSGITIENLADIFTFCEGRFTHIHPFEDFNGRVSRLLSWMLVLRFDLPRDLDLIPHAGDEDGKGEVIDALRAYDAKNWAPLTQIWRRRLEEAATRHSPTELQE
jgi:CRISPR-associated endonuclease/helicase Cas3